MSRRIEARSVKAMVNQPQPSTDAATAVLDAVHVIENAKDGASLSVCENPICRTEYKPTCLSWSTQRFCSDQCKQAASIIKRAAKLFRVLSDDEILKIVRTL
jgi:hypothetical protein